MQAVPENIIPIKVSIHIGCTDIRGGKPSDLMNGCSLMSTLLQEEAEDEQEDLLSGRPSRVQVRRDTAARQYFLCSLSTG